MNSNEVINDDMTLEQKLAAIDALTNSKEAQEAFNKKNGRAINAPVDPSDMTMCDGCQ